MELMCALYRAYLKQFPVRVVSASIFLILESTNAISFFKLARKWESLMLFWYKKEKCFLYLPYEIGKTSIKKKIGIILVVFMIFSSCKLIDNDFFV